MTSGSSIIGHKKRWSISIETTDSLRISEIENLQYPGYQGDLEAVMGRFNQLNVTEEWMKKNQPKAAVKR